MRFDQQVEAKVEAKVGVNCLLVEEAGGVNDGGVADDVGEGEEEGNGDRADHPDLVDAEKQRVEKSRAD